MKCSGLLCGYKFLPQHNRKTSGHQESDDSVLPEVFQREAL